MKNAKKYESMTKFEALFEFQSEAQWKKLRAAQRQYERFLKSFILEYVVDEEYFDEAYQDILNMCFDIYSNDKGELIYEPTEIEVLKLIIDSYRMDIENGEIDDIELIDPMSFIKCSAFK